MAGVMSLSPQTVRATFEPVQTTAPAQRPAGVKAPISSFTASGVPLMLGLADVGIATVALLPVFDVKEKCVCASNSEAANIFAQINTRNTFRCGIRDPDGMLLEFP
jgi:hypothetical protein